MKLNVIKLLMRFLNTLMLIAQEQLNIQVKIKINNKNLL